MTDLENLESYWDIRSTPESQKNIHVLCRQSIPAQIKNKLLVTVKLNQKLVQ